MRCLLLALVACEAPRDASQYSCTSAVEVTERDDGEAIQALLDAAVADGLPGVVLVLRHKNGQVWTGAAGLADVDAGAPMSSCTPMRIGAISNMMASTAMLTLAQEGRVDLDATVPSLLDDPGVAEIDLIDQVTLRQLLSHTSGIPDYQITPCALGFLNDPATPFTAEQAIACMASVPADFAPGADFASSNSNYVLVGQVLEALTGQSAAEVLRDRISVPMGLAKTSLSADGVAPEGTARGYTDLSGEGDIYDLTEFRLGAGLFDGGVVSNGEDLTLFAELLLARDFLDDPWLPTMKDEGEIEGDNTHYGLGLEVDRHSEYGRAFGHRSVGLSAQGQVWFLPDARLSVVLLVNGGLGVLQERAIQLSNEELGPLLVASALGG